MFNQWINRSKAGLPKFQIDVSKSNSANQNIADEARVILIEMTWAFADDLRSLNHRRPLLLFFDSINEASYDMELWLMVHAI